MANQQQAGVTAPTAGRKSLSQRLARIGAKIKGTWDKRKVQIGNLFRSRRTNVQVR
jgi:hypothetical protein